MSERHLPDDQSSTIDPYLITSVRQTLAEQSAALQNLSKQLDSGQYQRVLNLIMNCKGHVILSGMGKSGMSVVKCQRRWPLRVRLVSLFILQKLSMAIWHDYALRSSDPYFCQR